MNEKTWACWSGNGPINSHMLQVCLPWFRLWGDFSECFEDRLHLEVANFTSESPSVVRTFETEKPGVWSKYDFIFQYMFCCYFTMHKVFFNANLRLTLISISSLLATGRHFFVDVLLKITQFHYFQNSKQPFTVDSVFKIGGDLGARPTVHPTEFPWTKRLLKWDPWALPLTSESRDYPQWKHEYSFTHGRI
jgi:hypothetical protein